MIRSLDPLDLFQEAWRRSRILRVAALVGLASFLLLAIATIYRRIHPGTSLLIGLLDLGVWYFALAMADACREFRRLSRSPRAQQVEEAAALVALLTIGVSQGLFLIMAMRLLAPS
ncbi:MAG: hypothetical protein H6807_02570 [Planctomycetes bacterium]|nr:hypothetical protein [Planctomycetota bacterium]